MPLTKEQLTQKRFKFTISYPGSHWEIGEVFELRGNSCYATESMSHLIVHESILEAHPHIFQPLPWWSDRKPEDMPEYYKHTGNHGIFKTSFRPQGGIVMLKFSPTETVPTSLEYTLPATEGEYTAYINQKQQ